MSKDESEESQAAKEAREKETREKTVNEREARQAELARQRELDEANDTKRTLNALFQQRIQMQQAKEQFEANSKAAWYAEMNAEGGAASEAWKAVRTRGSEFYTKGHQGYDSWLSQMSNFIAFNQLLVNAYVAQGPIMLARIADIIGGVALGTGAVVGGTAWVAGAAVGAVGGVVAGAVGAAVTGQPVLTGMQRGVQRGVEALTGSKFGAQHDLVYHVQFDGKTNAVIPTLIRLDGKAPTAEETKCFRADVVAWFLGNGYEPNPKKPGGFLEKGTTNELKDVKVFNALNINDELKNYFAGLNIEATSSLRP